MNDADYQRVTPYLLRAADTMCPRRLRMEHEGAGKTQGAFMHSRVRDPFVEDARAAHADMAPPNPASFSERPDLLPEENAVLHLAAEGYLRLFGEQSARAIDHQALPSPFPAPKRRVTIGGYLDLALETPAGKELRQFELWGNDVCADPGESWTMLCLVLRLADWVGGGRLRLCHVDPLNGNADECTLDCGRELSKLASRFDRRLARLRARAADPRPEPSDACGTCPFIPRCEAHW